MADQDKTSIGCTVAAILVGIVVLAVIHQFVWGEQEGEVKVDDCRSKVSLEEGSVDTWFKKFTCSTLKSKSGKVLRGVCYSPVTDKGVCDTIYQYLKKPQLQCSDPKFPYPGYDDLCHADYQ